MFRWFKRAKQSLVPRSMRPLPIDDCLFEQGGVSLYEALSALWASSDPSLYTRGATSADVEALEDRYSIRLPEDFRSYLLHAAPSTTFMDDIGTQWWSLDEIKSYQDECPDHSPGQSNAEIERERDTYLVFADYLIWCYAWAVCCSDGANRGRIALIGGMPDAFVADKFRNFVRLELADAPTIHVGPSKQTSVGR